MKPKTIGDIVEELRVEVCRKIIAYLESKGNDNVEEIQ
jgi:hypothetical protein